jgi:hypothetical protein
LIPGTEQVGRERSEAEADAADAVLDDDGRNPESLGLSDDDARERRRVFVENDSVGTKGS